MTANESTHGQSVNSVPQTIREVTTILNNERRRLTLLYLDTRDRPVSIKELAIAIASVELDKPPNTIDSQERKRVYVSLQQNHFDRLEEAGIVDADVLVLTDTTFATTIPVAKDLNDGLRVVVYASSSLPEFAKGQADMLLDPELFTPEAIATELAGEH